MVACGTSTKQNEQIIQQVPVDQIYSSELEVIAKNPARITLNVGQVDFSFSKKSPLVNTDFGPSTAALVRFVNEQSGKYLVVWSWLHKASFAKVGVVFPKLSVYDSNGNLKKIKLVQDVAMFKKNKKKIYSRKSYSFATI